ncbi:MAG: hypothetical protein JWN10_1183 [Solirubrobacterales bacterium]|nr:hypothetical protein [Solirubrobacterales bacterium]
MTGESTERPLSRHLDDCGPSPGLLGVRSLFSSNYRIDARCAKAPHVRGG